MAYGNGMFYTNLTTMGNYVPQFNSISCALQSAYMKVAAIDSQMGGDGEYAGCRASLEVIQIALNKERQETRQLGVCMGYVVNQFTTAESNIVGDYSNSDNTSVQNYGSTGETMNEMGVGFDS